MYCTNLLLIIFCSWWDSISGYSWSPSDIITAVPPVDVVWHSFCVQWQATGVTYINNVLSNKTILFDILDFWCQLVVIRFVKTLSKRRMFVSSVKISACWLLHRWIKFNKICWEKRPAKTRPNLRTSFCRRDLKNTQLHLKVGISQTNADSQWNPVYNAFHRFFCCGNETIRR